MASRGDKPGPDWLIDLYSPDVVCQPNLENIYSACLTSSIIQDSNQWIFKINNLIARFVADSGRLCAIFVIKMKVIQKDHGYDTQKESNKMDI